eukprot:4803071-Prymnesium_polylepis.1
MLTVAIARSVSSSRSGGHLDQTRSPSSRWARRGAAHGSAWSRVTFWLYKKSLAAGGALPAGGGDVGERQWDMVTAYLHQGPGVGARRGVRRRHAQVVQSVRALPGRVRVLHPH